MAKPVKFGSKKSGSGSTAKRKRSKSGKSRANAAAARKYLGGGGHKVSSAPVEW